MNKEIEKLLDYTGISANDIPKIPLYMDQLLSFFDESLDAFKRNEDDNILTKTMVNNYVKAKALSPPEKKKYSHTQMMLLVMIFQLKNILSISELKQIVDIKRCDDKADNQESIQHYYERFRQEEQSQLGELRDYIEKVDKTDKEELVDTIMSLAIEASLKKRMAEMLFDYMLEKPDIEDGQSGEESKDALD